MRRVMTAAGALLAAAPMAFAAPPPASAATGTVVIEGDRVPRTRLADPAPGCHLLPSFPLLSRVSVINSTDADITLYPGEGCRAGLLRPATTVKAGTTRERTLTGTYSLLVQAV
ncbi:hypothetical protein Sme01_49380 [Sphaerisporangium melleum]|uniref:Secreted protein n=1 Tax=Sphaerisporangium melleum TaxID=321316 RepID=A0A917R3X2_9ACTN|nr:hypothetical protein [Sphaerisporangium melleum]GGK89112.1 hypothetical protein GCM10007964_34760 [Sphaerisporangium melleum]GII72462.1 hypothetical protein Sme01_49380 [Sphaerisporangium melleum]